ncbi:MAG: BMP family ABC transporter substrate-binding protein [Chloroflexota bacterium]
MARKLFAIVCLTAMLAMVPMAASAQDEIESACLVTDVGRVNDGTFNQYAYEGMLRAADDFDLDTTFIETTAQTEYANNINTCLTEEFDVIVTVGFLITDATHAAAEANPDIQFIGVDQFFVDPLPNLVGIQYREDQAGFLVGAMAALMSESGTIGGVYGVPIPPVVKFRNGYEQGARYINPDINVVGVYIDNFNAADRGATAAEQLIGEGADVIFGAGGTTGSGGTVRAAALDVYVIGVDQDEYFTTFGEGETPGSEYLISSAMKRVDNGVYDMIALLVNGDSFSEDSLYVLSLENDGIAFAPAHDSDVPQEVTDQVTEIMAGLLDGSIETGVNPGSGEMLEGEGAPLVALTAEPMDPMATMEATAAS